MSINEWYEDALRRREQVDSTIEAIICTARRKMELRCEIDAALDAGDEAAFYELTNELNEILFNEDITRLRG